MLDVFDRAAGSWPIGTARAGRYGRSTVRMALPLTASVIEAGKGAKPAGPNGRAGRDMTVMTMGEFRTGNAEVPQTALLADRAADSSASRATVEVPRTDSAAWYAIWTRSNFEQAVADQLATKGFDVFLPKAAAWARRGRTRRALELPLFPGYLFVHHDMDKPSHVEILKARGVVRVLGDRWDQLATVPPDEIEAVRRVAGAGLPVFPYPMLREGMRVRIVGGPLEGLEGIFLRGRPVKGLLVVSVNLLQRSVAVEVDCTLIEALP
jgi:transcription antitermination factor NusG